MNDYTGPTIVLAGTLRLGDGSSNSNLADSANVLLTAAAKLHLDFNGTDTVNDLNVGGVAKPPGVYSSSNSGFNTGPGTLTILSGPATDYDGWAAIHAITGSQSGDDDQDGLTNIDEYAFGLDPKSGTVVNPITVPLDKTTGTFTYTRRASSLTPLTYTVWTSDNLSNWAEDTGAIPTTTDIQGTDHQLVKVHLTPSLLTSVRLFVRVQAQ